MNQFTQTNITRNSAFLMQHGLYVWAPGKEGGKTLLLGWRHYFSKRTVDLNIYGPQGLLLGDIPHFSVGPP